MKIFRIALAAGILCFFSTGCFLFGSGVYEYEGNTFDIVFGDDPPAGEYVEDVDRVTAMFVLDEPLEPNLGGSDPTDLVDIRDRVLMYEFSDGRRNLNETDSNLSVALVATDAQGDIIFWEFLIGDGSNGSIYTANNDFPEDLGVIVDPASNKFDVGRAPNNPGEWVQLAQQ